MTHRIFNQSSRLIKIAVPVFIMVAVLLVYAFRGTIATAQIEKQGEESETSTIELVYLGYNL